MFKSCPGEISVLAYAVWIKLFLCLFSTSAWIKVEQLKPYHAHKEEMIKINKGKRFQQAVDAVEEFLRRAKGRDQVRETLAVPRTAGPCFSVVTSRWNVSQTLSIPMRCPAREQLWSQNSMPMPHFSEAHFFLKHVAFRRSSSTLEYLKELRNIATS